MQSHSQCDPDIGPLIRIQNRAWECATGGAAPTSLYTFWRSATSNHMTSFFHNHWHSNSISTPKLFSHLSQRCVLMFLWISSDITINCALNLMSSLDYRFQTMSSPSDDFLGPCDCIAQIRKKRPKKLAWRLCSSVSLIHVVQVSSEYLQYICGICSKIAQLPFGELA